jgi:hypothetical protein
MFICDFVAKMKMCQGEIHVLYFDLKNCFMFFQFLAFNCFAKVRSLRLLMICALWTFLTKIDHFTVEMNC